MPHDSAGNNRLHAEFVCRVLDVYILAAIFETRTAGDDFQMRQLRKPVNHALAQAVRQIIEIRIIASVLKWQNGNRGDWRLRRKKAK